MTFFGDSKNPEDEVHEGITSTENAVIHDGDLDFVVEYGGNWARPTYQDAAGAP